MLQSSLQYALHHLLWEQKHCHLQYDLKMLELGHDSLITFLHRCGQNVFIFFSYFFKLKMHAVYSECKTLPAHSVRLIDCLLNDLRVNAAYSPQFSAKDELLFNILSINA